ncbi:RNA-directed DNA polymerase, eukaryota [Tanacetum coccineum]
MLISWRCKKQTIVANSTTEAEYVAAANCFGQVLWIQNQMLDYGFNFMNTKIHIDNESTVCIVKNPVLHSKTKHIKIRYHFIRDSYEKRPIQVIKIHTDHNVTDLLTKAFDVSSDELRVKTGSCKVNAARQDLVLLGEKGNVDFHQIVDFLNASTIRYSLNISPTIYASYIEQFWATAQPKIVNNETQIHAKVDGKTIVISESSVRSNLHFNDEDGVTSLTNSEILEKLALMGYEIISDKITFQKAFFSPQWNGGEGSGQPSEPQPTPSPAPSSHEEQVLAVATSHPQKTQTLRQAKIGRDTKILSLVVPLKRLVMRLSIRSWEIGTCGSPRCQESMGGTIIQTRPERVPTPSYDSPLLGGNTPKSDEERLEQHELTDNVPPTPHDSPLPGEGLESGLMKTKKLYATAFKELINRVKSLESELNFQKSKSKRRRLTLVTSKDEEDLVADDPSKQGRSLIDEMDLDAGISLVPPHVEVQRRYGQNLETQEEVTTADAELNTASTFVSTASPQRNADTTADDLTLAETLMEIRKSAAKDNSKAKMDETESPRKMKQREWVQISRDEEGFTDAEWDDVLARVAADEEFFQQLQACEKCSEEDLPMKLVELVNQRKKFFAQQRAKANRKKPMTPAIQKDYMSNYIKNQEGGYSIKQLKSLSFEQVKEIFETTIRRVQSFVPMGSKLEVQRLNRVGQEVLEEPVKRQKIGEALVEELVIQPLQVRYPIIDWEVYSEDTKRDNLVKLWDLVKDRFSITESTDDKEKELWVELKRLFKPDNDDTLWKLQRYMHDPLVWRFYDTYGVHHVSSVRGHDIFMLVEKEYPLTRGTLGLMMWARLLVETDSEMSRGLLRKIFYQANRPRHDSIVMGDFNKVRSEEERLGSSFNVSGANEFNAFIANSGLIDLHLEGYSFTWSHPSAQKMSKLDRFLLSEGLLSIFPQILSICLDRHLSDHRPILLRVIFMDYGAKPFRLFHSWFSWDGFDKLVSDSWNGMQLEDRNDMVRFKKKLQGLKKTIREWVTDRKKNHNLFIKDTNLKLGDIDKKLDCGEASDELLLLRMNLMQSLQEKKSVDARDNLQKAKVKWAIVGDENTKYFHGIINKKRANLSIRGIMVDGEWIVEPIRVKEAFRNHFASRFHHPSSGRSHINFTFPNRLSQEQTKYLENHVSMDEIRKAVWDCGENKSPGPDGYTFEFFRKFWSLVGPDFCKAIQWFFNHSNFPRGCNSSFVALIPKVPDAKFVSDFRPISLIGSLYKVITKILANRLSSVLSDLVSDVQTTFVSNRQILDGPFIINELLSWCKRKKKRAMLFKVDFAKAYDSVRWDFFDDVLRSFGFGSKWRSWILGCLSSAMASVIVNGSPTSEFQFQCGLKQGDPLAPYLFTLVMESLHLSFSRVIEAGMFKDLSSMSKVRAWEDTICKIKSRLSNWKTKTLLIGGRLTLLKVVLGATLIYAMSLYKLPKTVLNVMESIRSKFFNGIDGGDKKITWIKWRKVLAAKKNGGPRSIRSVSSFYALNRALLFRWVWRFISQEDSFWFRLVRAIHGNNINRIQAANVSPWVFILREVHSLRARDTWMGDQLFKLMFSRIYALESNKLCTVAEKCHPNALDQTFRRSIQGGVESQQYTQLHDLIGALILSNTTDRWVWDLNGSGDFMVKDVRSMIDYFMLPKEPGATRWIECIPIKILLRVQFVVSQMKMFHIFFSAVILLLSCQDGIIAALIDVNATQSKLVLLENFNKNYSKCLRLLYKVNAAEEVNTASEEVSTANRKQSHKPKSEDINQEKLYLLYIDLCGPMRVASINGKKYILVIVDDCSRFTWVKFLASKDEAPDFIIKFLKMIQVRFNTPVRNIRTDNGTEFVNQTQRSYYESVAARTMLIYAKAPLFLWAEAVATACNTQNQSIIRHRHEKTLYEVLHDRKPDLSYLHVFGALCYLNNDIEDLGKLQAKADIGPELQSINPATSSSILVPNPIPQQPFLVADAPRTVDLADSPVSMSIDQDAPSTSIPSTQDQEHSLIISQGFEESPKTPHFHDDPLYEYLHEDSTSQGSLSNVRPIRTPFKSLGRWTKDHPIANVIGDPSRFVSTIKQLQTDAMWCYFDAFLTLVEPKNFKQAMTELDFLNDELKEEVYVSQPVGFVDQDNPSLVYKLKKALYVLKQAPRAWERLITVQDVDDGEDVILFRITNISKS